MSIKFRYYIYIIIFIVSRLSGVSAPPHSFEIKQVDGQKIPVRMYGHEYYNWLETDDGYVVDWVDNEYKKGLYYREIDKDGKYITSNVLVEYPAPVNLNISKKLREDNPELRLIKHSHRHNDINSSLYLNRSINIEIIKPLILLVDFNNLPSSVPDAEFTKEQFYELFFAEGLDPSINNFPSNYEMSVNDYFTEVSNGKMKVVGSGNSVSNWTLADNDYSFYVDNAQGTGTGENGLSRSAAALALEILNKNDSNIDFTEFDGDNDNVVDVVILIVEGWVNGDNDQFWPHMSIISPDISENYDSNNNGYADFDNIDVVKYIVISEKYFYDNGGVQKGDIHPIGTICHELGHVVGLPDLYDTSSNGAAGIGDWGLMGSGNYSSQYSPAYFNAWSRYRLGFIEPVDIFASELTNGNYHILIPAETNDNDTLAYRVALDSHMPHEYLLLENRQKIGSDKFLANSGLLIWHVDEIITDMYPANNSVNVDPNYYGVNLIQADGQGDLYEEYGSSDSKDVFPGALAVNNKSNFSTYSYDRNADGSINTGKQSGIVIDEIDEVNDNIQFYIEAPNNFGSIIGWDEGNYEGYAINTNNTPIQWAGVRLTAPIDGFLSGVKTVFPSSQSSTNLSYAISIWQNWNSQSNKPIDLIYTYQGSVNWDQESFRDGGWAFISLIDRQIEFFRGQELYIEVKYIGSGFNYNYNNYGSYLSSQGSGRSYYRENQNNSCSEFNSLSISGVNLNGDWNIRAVFSGSNDVLSNTMNSLPQVHQIYSNYPNPFNPVTTIPFYLSYASEVVLNIYDLEGREIIEKDFSFLSSGYHEFKIDLNQFSSGIYLYTFNINDKNYKTSKMIFLK